MPSREAPTYSIITTCKGRLDDLKRSLPSFVRQPRTEVIVVDYDCPQGTKDYVRAEYPAVKVVAVTDQPLFDPANARNRGAAEAAADTLAFLDADIVIADGFLEHAPLPDDEKAFATFTKGSGNSVRGSCIVRREDFVAIGGYDTLLPGYEGEDLDLYMRLRVLGARRIALDPSSVDEVIEQSDEERMRFRPPNMKRQFLRGQLYQLAKEMLMRGSGLVQLELALRKRIMAQVDLQLDAVFAGEKDFELSFTLPDRYERGMLGEWDFSSAITVRARRKAPK